MIVIIQWLFTSSKEEQNATRVHRLARRVSLPPSFGATLREDFLTQDSTGLLVKENPTQRNVEHTYA